MRYQVLAIGRLKRGFFRTGCEHYLGRLQALAKADLIELREGRGADADEVRAAEGGLILGQASGRLIALDERGDRMRTRELADRIESLELKGVSLLSLVVGGPEGLAENVRARADEVWRLSDLTLPHEMARLVLLEQLYRVETLRRGHPYHRE